jgi:hypothetical protein
MAAQFYREWADVGEESEVTEEECIAGEEEARRVVDEECDAMRDMQSDREPGFDRYIARRDARLHDRDGGGL